MNSLDFLTFVNQIIWGVPITVLLLGIHCYFTIRSNFIQKKIGSGIRYSLQPTSSSKGTISGFASLTTTLAATIGTGNIIGVSTAVYFGGAGAVFWCWITGLLGMATTYAECFLGVKYHRKTSSSSVSFVGGPMYILDTIFHQKFLAVLFSLSTIFVSFGVGCFTQANSITQTTSSLWNLSPNIVGFVVALLIGFILVGGVSGITSICMKLVPAMAIFYISSCIYLLIINYNYILPTLSYIMKSAFFPSAVVGGIVGNTAKLAARYGIARGLFTNEAGLGSAPIIAANTQTDSPKKQAKILMSATFWDTVVMCAITGFVIVTNLLHYPNSTLQSSASDLTTAAFRQIPYIGESMLGCSLLLFAIATLIGWSFFGERAVFYLFGEKGVKPYLICYIVMIYIGSLLSADFVWQLCDFLNIFMMLPNLYVLIRLRHQIEY